MSKIISLFIIFLNRINKFIWKIIIFLSKFIKIDDINHLDNKPVDERYRLFKVDDPAVIEPFITIEHKNHKLLIKDNNIKPINRRNGKSINIDFPTLQNDYRNFIKSPINISRAYSSQYIVGLCLTYHVIIFH